MRLSIPWEQSYQVLFGPSLKEKVERFIVGLSMVGFGIHLAAIAFTQWGLIAATGPWGNFLTNPISALYTPFSFILIWEVYLLIEQLPRSFTSSVQKQFEIIALILIRRVFKDISMIDFSGTWLLSEEHYSLLIDVGVFLLLFLLIYLFKRLRGQLQSAEQDTRFERFIHYKRRISVILVPVLAGLIVYELGRWLVELYHYQQGTVQVLSDVNAIFYHDFFVILIWVDVLILLISLNFIQGYSQLIRNSGYIVSTVLIRLSFTIQGQYNSLLILLGVGFGVALLAIYNMVRRQEEDS